MDALLETISETPVKAIEVKLSQGLSQVLGGFPAKKVTSEIAAIENSKGVMVQVLRHTNFMTLVAS